jgi:hypothetical protein
MGFFNCYANDLHVWSDDLSSVSGNIFGRVFPFFIWQLCHYSNPLHMVPCFFIWLMNDNNKKEENGTEENDGGREEEQIKH